MKYILRTPLKMHFFRDSCVSSVLESSCITYTLRFCARRFLALTKKSLFLEIPLYILITISLIGLPGCQGRKDVQNKREVIAWVNGKPITHKDFIDIWEENTDGEVIQKEEIDDLRRSFLDHLIEEKLILEEGKRLGIKVEDSEIEERIESIKGGISEEEFRVKVIERHNSMDIWRGKLEREILLGKIVDEVISPYGIVTEEDALAYYKSHLKEFNSPQEFRALQIVVKSEEDAKGLLTRIKNGEDFQELARKNSLSPDREKGGDLGFFAKGEMPEEFEKVIFSLTKEKVSSVVKSHYGYHIFKLMEKRKERLLKFSEVKDRIVSKLALDRQNNAFSQWVENLKKKAEIKTDIELLKKIV